MEVIKASQNDSDRLIQFFASNPLPGKLSLNIHRQGDFFSKYKLFSKDFVTFMIVDKKNEVHGIASLNFIPAIIEGEEQTIAIATDLRVEKSRKALLTWSDNFLNRIVEEREKRNCKYIFTPIGRSRISAFKSFIRPRSVSRNFPRYHLFRKFNVVTIHGMYPFSTSPLSTIDLVQAQTSDIDQLQNYIAYQQNLRPLYFPQKHEDLLKHIENWPGLRLSDFILAKDKNNNIIGCMSLWDGSKIETYTPVSKTKRVQTFERTINALSLIGVTHPFLGKSNTLHIKQINHLYADNPDIFYTMLRHAYKTTPKTYFLSYIHFENQLKYLPARSFISQSVPYNFYCLLAPNDPVPSFLKPTFLEMPPDIDMAII